MRKACFLMARVCNRHWADLPVAKYPLLTVITEKKPFYTLYPSYFGFFFASVNYLAHIACHTEHFHFEKSSWKFHKLKSHRRPTSSAFEKGCSVDKWLSRMWLAAFGHDLLEANESEWFDYILRGILFFCLTSYLPRIQRFPSYDCSAQTRAGARTFQYMDLLLFFFFYRSKMKHVIILTFELHRRLFCLVKSELSSLCSIKIQNKCEINSS